MLSSPRSFLAAAARRASCPSRRLFSSQTATPPLTRSLNSDNNVLTLTIDRPGNALNLELWELLAEQLHQVSDEDNIRAVVLQAQGPLFSVGHDWAELLASDPQQQLHILQQQTIVLQALGTLPQPTVCALQGLAAGAGCQLAIACDLVVASPLASLGAGNHHLPSSLGVSLPPLIGQGRTLDMLLSPNYVIPAKQALEWGLVSRVAGNPQKQAADWAAELDSTNKRIWNAHNQTKDLTRAYQTANQAMVVALQDAQVQAAVQQHLQDQAAQSTPRRRPAYKQFSEIPSGAEMHRMPLPPM